MYCQKLNSCQSMLLLPTKVTAHRVWLEENIPVTPFVTRLQFTALGWTALSSSRKKMPSAKLLSCWIEIVMKMVQICFLRIEAENQKSNWMVHWRSECCITWDEANLKLYLKTIHVTLASWDSHFGIGPLQNISISYFLPMGVESQVLQKLQDIISHHLP